jgi:hypothetical protein
LMLNLLLLFHKCTKSDAIGTGWETRR